MSSWSQNGSYVQLGGRKCVELVAKWIICPTRREKACRVRHKIDLMTNSEGKSVSSWSQNGSYVQLGGIKRVELVAKWILCPTRREKVCRVGRKMDLMSNSEGKSVSSWSQNESYAQLAGRKRVELVAKWIICPTRREKSCRVGRKTDLTSNSQG